MICPHCDKPIRMKKRDDTALFGEVVYLRAKGVSIRAIAQFAGISPATVWRWTAKPKKKTRKAKLYPG